MGRKRLENRKKNLNLKIDADLLNQLNADGINKSRLFSMVAENYINGNICSYCKLNKENEDNQ